MSQEELEKKSLEKMLIAKNKELELFMYRASHDLRGPLSTTKGILQLALEECKEQPAAKYFQFINVSTTKLEAILNDLTEIVFIKGESVFKTEINFNKIFNEITETYTMVNDIKHNVRFESNLDTSKPIFSDEKLLKIVLRNIIQNSVKYSKPDCKDSFVKIVVKSGEDSFWIEVEDNGMGIGKDQIKKIFDMFYRGTNYSMGSGLGLYIAKNAVDKLEGKITCVSEEKVGTKIQITIPN